MGRKHAKGLGNILRFYYHIHGNHCPKSHIHHHSALQSKHINSKLEYSFIQILVTLDKLQFNPRRAISPGVKKIDPDIERVEEKVPKCHFSHLTMAMSTQ